MTATLFAASLLALSAQSSVAAPGDGPRQCPEMRLSGIEGNAEAAMRSALRDACAIMADIEFERAIEAQDLDRACKGFFFAKRKRIASREALAAVAEIPAFTVKTGTFALKRTTAKTSVTSRTITIAEHWLERALQDGSSQRGDLVNTLAHEMMHLIPAKGDPSAYRFSDDGQSTPWCKRSRLVSYAVGDTVETIWRRRNGL